MYTFEIKDGDLNLEGGLFTTLGGKAMLAQELTTWILEPIGSDKTNDKFGSALSTYIGVALYTESIDEVESELYRVLNNFVIYYAKQYEDDVMSGQSARYNSSDVIRSIESINLVQNIDSITAKITLNTYDGAVTITKVV